MLTKTLSEAKKKQRNILIKAMNNDIGSIDSAKDSWNPAQISERAKDISYIRSLVDTWNPAQLNEALKMLDLPVIDTWNPAQIEEQRRNLVFYLVERTLTGNPITLNILGNLTPEVTGLNVTMNPIQDLHGYSNPWIGGAGKNKIKLNITTQTVSDVVLTVYDDGTFEANGTASEDISFVLVRKSSNPISIPEGTLTLSGCPSGGSSSGYRLSSWRTGAGSSFDTGSGVSFGYESTQDWAVSLVISSGTQCDHKIFKPMVCLSTASEPTVFAPYSNICPISGRTEVSVTITAGEDVETKTHEYSETIYGGVDDFVNGGLTNEWGYIASYDGETLPGEWISDRDVYAPDTTPTAGAEVAYRLETPTTIETSAEGITLLKGENVLSTDGDSIELKYKQNF